MTLLADLHRGSDPLPNLLNITTCDVTRGAVVEISEDPRRFRGFPLDFESLQKLYSSKMPGERQECPCLNAAHDDYPRWPFIMHPR